MISKVWLSRKVGFETLRSSIQFFYSHILLIVVSLIPSIIRAIQMLNSDAPIWLDGIVWVTRCFFFLLVISVLARFRIKELRNKEVWDKISNSCSVQLKRTWPYGFSAQLIVFFIFLYGIGNLLIMLMSWLFISTLETMGIQVADFNAIYNASLYFLKNMTVIPLTFVYILNMIGFRSSNQ